MESNSAVPNSRKASSIIEAITKLAEETLTWCSNEDINVCADTEKFEVQERGVRTKH